MLVGISILERNAVVEGISEWLKSPETIRKSRKKYAHFDKRVDIGKVRNYLTNPDNVAHHGFYPFIHYTKTTRKYSIGSEGNWYKKTKQREISYAAHLDSCIYQYYSFLLNRAYEQKLIELGISDVPVAYRANGMNNIKVANRAFDFIIKSQECSIIIGDFTDFFDKLDHRYLKRQICKVLGQYTLPKDYYAVFKNITAYSVWERGDLLTLHGFANDAQGVKTLNSLDTVFEGLPGYYHKYRNQIHKHRDKFGIPQGSPISGCLANIYMLSIDKEITAYVKKYHGIYMRYSDDFIIVIPGNREKVIKHIVEQFQMYQNQKLLTLQPEKTQIFQLYADKTLTNISEHVLGLTIESTLKVINFLGFKFDGKEVTLRPKTVSKYYYRMRHKAIGIAHQYWKHNRFVGQKDLYRRYAKTGTMSKNLKKAQASPSLQKYGNFLSYVDRAKREFADQPVDRDTKNHMRKIRKCLKKHKRTY